jgi:hypothetical protein
MAYILLKDRPQNSYEEWQSGWSNYCAYLESVKNRLPPSAYDFASAPWHYDFDDHRAPHDGWVDEIVIRESTMGEQKENRALEIVVRLFGAYQDGHIELRYSEVQSYLLASGDTIGLGHGDWLYDEIRLSDRERVLHEVEWSRGNRWLIECRDVTYEWRPLCSIGAAS